MGALLSALLGAFLALLYLAWKPTETVTQLPEQPEARTVYYQPGTANAGKGRQYLRKRQMLLEGGASEVLTLSEDELNAWIASSRANPNAGTGSDGGIFTPQTINFRIRDGQLQLGLPGELNLFGMKRAVVVQARGGFEKDGDRFVFAPDELYLGSLAAHRVPGLSRFIMGSMLSGQTVPEELRTAWKRLERVEVQGDQLVLALP